MAAGIAVQLTLPGLLPDLVPAGIVDPWQPAALLRGLLLGLGVALLFSAPPLITVWRVPPARVLRRDAEPLAASRWASSAAFAALAVGTYLMATVQSGSADLGARFVGGLVAVTAVLALAAALVTRLAGRLPRGIGRVWLRHGLAALGRPGAATLGAVVALGLGVLVVLAMSLVERQLAAQLSAELPESTPSAFLVDIQPDQWPAVETLLRRQGGEEIRSVPVVTARLTAIDGKGADELARRDSQDRSRRWALTREQRLTYLDELPEGNRVVAGALWSEPGVPEVSVEEGFAHDLGVTVGSVLSFDIQGVPLDLTVTSLRTVDWESFGINFFLVAEPGVLDAAPQQRLATVRLPEGREQQTQDLLAAGFPNVTYLAVREILGKIVAVLERLGLGVRVLGGFTVLAGIAILGGAVSAASAQRGREVALLKTLGMTRRGVISVFSVEYALVGLVAGAIGAIGGGVLAWAVLTGGMELSWTFRWVPFAVAVAGSVLLTVAAGLAASLRALARRPIEVLRGE
jgi:putative ABC transport system permease protein